MNVVPVIFVQKFELNDAENTEHLQRIRTGKPVPKELKRQGSVPLWFGPK